MSNSASTLAADRAALLQILKSNSVFHGDFVLASGAKSNYYIDCRITTLNPQGAWLVGAIMHEMIRTEAAKRGLKLDAVGGLTLGADPVALAIGMASFQSDPKEFLKVFTVRKSPKAHGQTKLIEGNFQKGHRVVIVDDVVTKGDSTLRAIEAVRAEGGKVELVAVLVDREEGGRAKIEALGLPVLSVFKKADLLG